MRILKVYKDWLVTWIILRFKLKPFYLKTHIDYVLLSFKASGYLPEKIKAIELFGMYGLYVTKHYANLCEYVELWEIDPFNVKYARKFMDSNVNVIEGNSVSAVQNNTIKNKFNLLIIDNPLVSPYGENLIEHFDVMPNVFDIAESHFIVVFNVIHSTPDRLYSDYQMNSDEETERKKRWIERRKEFYGTEEQPTPQKYIDLYANKFNGWGLETKFSVFLPRNERVGFLGFALKKHNHRS